MKDFWINWLEPSLALLVFFIGVLVFFIVVVLISMVVYIKWVEPFIFGYLSK